MSENIRMNADDPFMISIPAPKKKHLLPEGDYLYTVKNVRRDIVIDPSTQKESPRVLLTLSVPLLDEFIEVKSWLYFDTEENLEKIHKYYCSIGIIEPDEDAVNINIGDTVGYRGRAHFTTCQKKNGETDNCLRFFLDYNQGLLGPFTPPARVQPAQKPVPQSGPAHQQLSAVRSVPPAQQEPPAAVVQPAPVPAPQPVPAQGTQPASAAPKPAARPVTINGAEYVQILGADGQVYNIPANSAALSYPAGFTPVIPPDDLPF